MDERLLAVCAIALFADGYSPTRIAGALSVDEESAQKLAEQETKLPEEGGAGPRALEP